MCRVGRGVTAIPCADRVRDARIRRVVDVRTIYRREEAVVSVRADRDRRVRDAQRVQRTHADSVSTHTITPFFPLILYLLPSNLLTWLQSQFRSCNRPETSLKAYLFTGPCHSAFLTLERNTWGTVASPTLILARLFPSQKEPLLKGKESTKPYPVSYKFKSMSSSCGSIPRGWERSSCTVSVSCAYC